MVAVTDSGIECLLHCERLAETDVDDALESRGTWIGVPVFELLLERRHDLGRVALTQAAGHDLISSCSPQCLQTRT